MGAPLKTPALPNTIAKHHILQLDSTTAGITVTPIWFDGPPSLAPPETDPAQAPAPQNPAPK